MDSGVVEGGEVPVTYDPMLAKLIVQAETRAAAIDRAIAALHRYPVLGIRTNIPFLIRALDHDAFRSGDLHTGFIEEHLEELTAPAEPTPAALAAAATAMTQRTSLASAGAGTSSEATAASHDPWTALQRWGR